MKSSRYRLQIIEIQTTNANAACAVLYDPYFVIILVKSFHCLRNIIPFFFHFSDEHREKKRPLIKKKKKKILLLRKPSLNSLLLFQHLLCFSSSLCNLAQFTTCSNASRSMCGNSSVTGQIYTDLTWCDTDTLIWKSKYN